MRKLGIMKNVSFGCRDTNYVHLWFDVYTDESRSSLQRLPATEAIAVLEKHGVSNIKSLEGKSCWVEEDDYSMKFIDLAKI